MKVFISFVRKEKVAKTFCKLLNSLRQKLNPGLLMEDHGRCKGKSGYGLRCIGQAGHTGKHQYVNDDEISFAQAKDIMQRFSPHELRNMACCDTVSVIQGRDNFKSYRALIGKMHEHSLITEQERDAAIKLVKKTENFIKGPYKDALTLDHNKCGHLCLRHLLRHDGSKYPFNWHEPLPADERFCTQIHTHECQELVDAEDLLHRLECMLKGKQGGLRQDQHGRRHTLREMRGDLQIIADNYHVYLSHIVRLVHEEKQRQKRDNAMGNDEAEITVDWKMKLLTFRCREAMSAWFGKRGTSLIGFMTKRRMPRQLLDEGPMLSRDRVAVAEDWLLQYHVLLTDDTVQGTYKFVLGWRETYKKCGNRRAQCASCLEDIPGHATAYGNNADKSENGWRRMLSESHSLQLPEERTGNPWRDRYVRPLW